MAAPGPGTTPPWGRGRPAPKTSRATTRLEAACSADAAVPPRSPEKVVRPFPPSTTTTTSPHITTTTCPRTTTRHTCRRPPTPRLPPLRTTTPGRRTPFTVPCWGRRPRALPPCQAAAAAGNPGVKADPVPVRRRLGSVSALGSSSSFPLTPTPAWLPRYCLVPRGTDSLLSDQVITPAATLYTHWFK